MLLFRNVLESTRREQSLSFKLAVCNFCMSQSKHGEVLYEVTLTDFPPHCPSLSWNSEGQVVFTMNGTTFLLEMLFW